MAARDLYNEVKVSTVIRPHSPSATGTISGLVIDTAGFSATTFVLEAGNQTTANLTVTPIIKSGSATDALTSCADTVLLGTETAGNLSGTAGQNEVRKIGYIGSDRYVTCDLAVVNAATGTYAVQAVQSSSRKQPQGQS